MQEQPQTPAIQPRRASGEGLEKSILWGSHRLALYETAQPVSSSILTQDLAA